MKPCPCQSGFDYPHCCGPFHAGLQPAVSALALMRSRYSAYALGRVDYIIRTTHPENEQYSPHVKAWRKQLEAHCKSTKFTGLAILEDEPGDSESFVKFEASFTQQNKPFKFREKSRFLKVDDHWLYHSGDTVLGV